MHRCIMHWHTRWFQHFPLSICRPFKPGAQTTQIQMDSVCSSNSDEGICVLSLKSNNTSKAPSFPPQMVSHPSTNYAQHCLILVIGWESVYSMWVAVGHSRDHMEGMKFFGRTFCDCVLPKTCSEFSSDTATAARIVINLLLCNLSILVGNVSLKHKGPGRAAAAA